MHAHRLLVRAPVRSALVLAARLALVAGGAVRPAAPAAAGFAAPGGGPRDPRPSGPAAT
jgi:hypothetical protein